MRFTSVLGVAVSLLLSTVSVFGTDFAADRMQKVGAMELETKRTETSRMFIKPSGETTLVFSGAESKACYSYGPGYVSVRKNEAIYDFVHQYGNSNLEYSDVEGFCSNDIKSSVSFRRHPSTICNRVDNVELYFHNTEVGIGKRVQGKDSGTLAIREVTSDFYPLSFNLDEAEAYYNALDGQIMNTTLIHSIGSGLFPANVANQTIEDFVSSEMDLGTNGAELLIFLVVQNHL